MRRSNTLKIVNELVLSVIGRKTLEPGSAEKARRLLRKLELARKTRDWKKLEAAVDELARLFIQRVELTRND